MAFCTILVSPGLSETAYRRALQAGPPSAAPRREHQAMLRSAGFVGIVEADVTAEYLRTARGWPEARERHAAELRQSEGNSQFEEKQAQDRAEVRAIEDGLLRRSLFVAERSR